MKIYFNNGRKLSVSEEKLSAILKELAEHNNDGVMTFYKKTDPLEKIIYFIRLGDISYIK